MTHDVRLPHGKAAYERYQSTCAFAGLTPDDRELRLIRDAANFVADRANDPTDVELMEASLALLWELLDLAGMWLMVARNLEKRAREAPLSRTERKSFHETEVHYTGYLADIHGVVADIRHYMSDQW